jgi:hypothetical protein
MIGVAVGSGVFVSDASTSVGLFVGGSAGISVAMFVVEVGVLQELKIKTAQSSIKT